MAKVHHSFSKRTGQRVDATNKHRKPFPKIAREIIDNSDIILEILDARFFKETRNEEIENSIKEKGKILIYVLNKSDLVDSRKLKRTLGDLRLYPYVLVSCKNRKGAKELKDRLKIESKKVEVNESDKFGKVRVGVIGYPNTGKSSVINFLTGKSSAGTSAESGFTRGVKKIKLNEDIMLYDTPGVIPEGENSNVNKLDLVKHAQINVRTWDKVKEPEFIIAEIAKNFPQVLENFYNLDAHGDAEMILEELGKRRHFLKKGGEIDVERTARSIIRDWQEGKIRF